MKPQDWNVVVVEQYGVWSMYLYRAKAAGAEKVEATQLNGHLITPRRFWGKSIDERVSIEAERFRQVVQDIELRENLQRNRNAVARRLFLHGGREG